MIKLNQFTLADRKWHYIQGWAMRYNPDAKTYPYTAWRYRGERHGARAKRLRELVAKMEVIEEGIVRRRRTSR